MPPKRKASTDLNKENHHDFDDEIDDDDEYNSDDHWAKEYSSPLVVFSRYSSDDSWASESSGQYTARMKREDAAVLAAKKASMSPEDFEKWSIERDRCEAAWLEAVHSQIKESDKFMSNAAEYVPAPSGHTPARSKFAPSASMAAPGASNSTSAVSKLKSCASKSTSAASKPISGLSSVSKPMPAATRPKPTTMIEQLRALRREDLEAYCLQLQQQVSALSSSSAASTGAATLGPDELAKRVSTLRSIIATQLEKSLKWSVACKRGTAIFNQSFAVPDAQLFLALTEQPKMLKYKKYSAEDFQEHVVKRSLIGSIRYKNLYMTGNVIVRYDESEGILKITGKYGI